MAEPKGGVKTLAIQLTDDQHAQLVLISQVEGLSLKSGASSVGERRSGLKMVRDHPSTP